MYKIIKLYTSTPKGKREESNVFMYMKAAMSVVAYDYIELWHDWNACIVYNPKESQNWHKSEKEGVLLTDMTITC